MGKVKMLELFVIYHWGISLFKYRLSFTAAGLVFTDSVKLTNLYLQYNDWNDVRHTVYAENILQANTISSMKRMYIEISSRLQQLDDAELSVFVESSEQEQRYILWLAICRNYKFIEEFAVEVVREKFLSMDMKLDYHDYEVFFNKKSDWHEELGELADSTRYKLRQVIFKMLKETEILTKDNYIMPVILSPRIAREIFSPPNSQAVIYPISDADLGGLLI